MYNPSPMDVNANPELFITEAEMKAKYYDTEGYRKEREAKSDMYMELVQSGLFNLYSKMDHSHSEAHNFYGNYG